MGLKQNMIERFVKSIGMCDSFLGEGKVGVSQAATPLPATSHPVAPLPWEGIKSFKYFGHS